VLEAVDDGADDCAELLGLLASRRDEEAWAEETADEDITVEAGMLEEERTVEDGTLDGDSTVDEATLDGDSTIDEATLDEAMLDEAPLDEDSTLDEDTTLLLLTATLLDTVDNVLTDEDTACEEDADAPLLDIVLLTGISLLGNVDDTWIEETAAEDDTVEDSMTDEDHDCEEGTATLLMKTTLLNGTISVLDVAGRVDGLCAELKLIVEEAILLLEDNTDDDCSREDDCNGEGLENADDSVVELTPLGETTSSEELILKDVVVAIEEGAELRHVVDIHDHK